MVAPPSAQHRAVTAKNANALVRLARPFRGARIAHEIVLHAVHQFHATAIEDEREIVRHEDGTCQMPGAIRRRRVPGKCHRPRPIGKRRVDAARDCVRIRRRRHLQMLVCEIHESFPVVGAELAGGFVAVVAHAILKPVGTVEIVRGVPGVSIGSRNVDEPRRDKTNEIICTTGICVVGKAGDDHCKTFIPRPRTERRLPVSHDSHARRIQFGTGGNPVQSTRISPCHIATPLCFPNECPTYGRISAHPDGIRRSTFVHSTEEEDRHGMRRTRPFGEAAGNIDAKT